MMVTSAKLSFLQGVGHALSKINPIDPAQPWYMWANGSGPTRSYYGSKAPRRTIRSNTHTAWTLSGLSPCRVCTKTHHILRVVLQPALDAADTQRYTSTKTSPMQLPTKRACIGCSTFRTFRRAAYMELDLISWMFSRTANNNP